MTSHRRLFPLAAVLGVSVVLASSESANAQLGPSLRATYIFGMGPNVPRNPFLPILPAVPGHFVYRGYTVSGVGMNGPYTFTLRSYSVGTASIGYPSIEPVPSLGSGFGNNSKVTAEQRSAIGQAQRNAKWDTGVSSTTPDFDRWLKDAANRREATPAKEPKALDIDPALIEPSEEAILSGEALNKLAAQIRELEKQGKKATPGLLAPELTTKIVFTGGVASDAANLFRETELQFPTTLKVTGFNDLRTELEKAFAVVVKEVHAGKKANQPDVDRLLKAAHKAHESTRQLVADAPFGEACDVCDFFAKLESATKYLKDEKSVGVAGADWSVVGATVAEVVRHETKYGLRFGPAKNGDEAAYFSLHRGLLAYCVGLAQTK